MYKTVYSSDAAHVNYVLTILLIKQEHKPVRIA